MFCEERECVVSDWVYILFQGEVTAVDEMDLRIGHVFLKGLSSCREKDGIIFAPNREDRRMYLSQFCVPLRVLLHVILIVVEKSELDRGVARPVEGHLIEGIAVGTDVFGIARPLGVLELRGLESEQATDLLLSFGIFFSPIGGDRHIPKRTLDPLRRRCHFA